MDHPDVVTQFNIDIIQVNICKFYLLFSDFNKDGTNRTASTGCILNETHFQLVFMYDAVVSAMNHPDPFNPYMGLFNFRSIRRSV